MAAISVVICCANAADTLEAACRSVAWADEVIVVDSGSTDATAGIARSHAHRYVVEPWRGYSKQKEFGSGLARNPWVLVLDGDEECSPPLAAEIQGLSEAWLERYDVVLMRRRNYVMGRHIASWSPDWQSRLIHRDRAAWSDDVLHEDRLPRDRSKIGRLQGCLEHKRTSSAGFADYFSGRRMDERLLLVARQMHARGRRCRWWDLALRPKLAFWKSYLVKRGFLEGALGLIIAQKAAVSTQLKYAALWAVQQGRAGAGDPVNPP